MGKKMKFDKERYLRESQDEDLVAGKKKINEEDCAGAWQHLEQAHKRGNVLAGTLMGIICYSRYWEEWETDPDGARATKDTKNPDDAKDTKDLKEICTPENSIPYFEEGMENGCPLAAAWAAEAMRMGRGMKKNRKKALALYETCRDALKEMADAGNDDAQYACGYDLLFGNFSPEGATEQEKEEGLRLLNLAIDSGHLRAPASVARAALTGIDAAGDEDAAADLLERYADRKCREIHSGLGDVYCFGLGRDKDEERGMAEYELAAGRGSSYAQYMLGLLYYIEDDYKKSEYWFARAAELKDVGALINIVWLHVFEGNVGIDLKRAKRELKEAEKLLSADGGKDDLLGDECVKLSEIYIELYPEKKKQLAFDYLCMALALNETRGILDLCRMHFVDGFCSELLSIGDEELLERLKEEEDFSLDADMALLLGNIYDRGLGVSKDEDEAEIWYEKAMGKGFPEAGFWLVARYFRTRRLENGVEVLNRLYNMGDVNAASILGSCYENGHGVKKDREMALKLYREAADLGNEEAAVKLKKLEEESDLS